MNEFNIKADFPIFQHFKDQNLPFIYLDSAATTQLPGKVIDRLQHFFTAENASTNRGIYPLGWGATQIYEQARETVAEYLGAKQPEDVLFTAGVTHSINLVALGFLEQKLKKGDQVVVSVMEHHANFIPWQRLCAKKGAELLVMDIDPLTGTLQWDQEKYFADRVQMIAVGLVSNVMGNRHPIENIAARARRKQIPVLVDAAQGLSDGNDLVNKLGVDFIAFSGHKMFGPTGIGVLWITPERQSEMEPVILGGGMVEEVGIRQTVYSGWPSRMEPGTPNTGGALGLATGLQYWQEGIEIVEARTHLRKLQEKVVHFLLELGGTQVYTNLEDGRGILSFSCDWVHPHDLATFLGQKGICIRAGHHCAQPLMERLSVGSLSRVSLSYYNDEEDVEIFVNQMIQAQNFFK